MSRETEELVEEAPSKVSRFFKELTCPKNMSFFVAGVGAKVLVDKYRDHKASGNLVSLRPATESHPDFPETRRADKLESEGGF
jgi:hypothetical protein